MSFFNPFKFAEWLSNAYKESRFKSWQEVADKIGTTRSTLSRYAGAKPQTLTDKPSQPSPELVVKLAKVFGDDVDKVLMLAGYAAQNAAPEETHDILDGVRVSFDEKKLTKAEKETILSAMRIIAAGAKATAPKDE